MVQDLFDLLMLWLHNEMSIFFLKVKNKNKTNIQGLFIFSSYFFLVIIVARVRRRGDRPPHSNGVWIWKKRGDKGILVSYRWKNRMESPPSIMVTRNPNWSQRSGTEIGCVNERY